MRFSISSSFILAPALLTTSGFAFPLIALSRNSKINRYGPGSGQVKLYQSGDKEIDDKSAKVRFSGLELRQQSTSGFPASSTNPLDSVLSLITSDIGSIILGAIGLTLLVVERLSLPDASSLGLTPVEYAEQLGEETRSNLIAVLATGSLFLNGLSKLDVTSAIAEAVELEGIDLEEPLYFGESMQKSKEMLQWAMESLIRATPAMSVVVLQKDVKWQVVSMMGKVPNEAKSKPSVLLQSSTPILDRSEKDSSRETYLPTLQALPGKTEFTYLPGNTQEVLIFPIPASPYSTMALVLGSNRAKSFTPRDIAWCQTVAGRLATVLSDD